VKKEVPVTTVEDGVVITNTKADALEARVLASFRKPFFLLGGLIVLIFVLLLGGSVFLNHLDDTVNHMQTNVNNTDKIVTEVAGPAARKVAAEQQKQFIETFSQGLSCDQQNNLQRLIDQLAQHGLAVFADVNVIKPPCTKEE
jgi:hypothetical protein